MVASPGPVQPGTFRAVDCDTALAILSSRTREAALAYVLQPGCTCSDLTFSKQHTTNDAFFFCLHFRQWQRQGAGLPAGRGVLRVCCPAGTHTVGWACDRRCGAGRRVESRDNRCALRCLRQQGCRRERTTWAGHDSDSPKRTRQYWRAVGTGWTWSACSGSACWLKGAWCCGQERAQACKIVTMIRIWNVQLWHLQHGGAFAHRMECKRLLSLERCRGRRLLAVAVARRTPMSQRGEQ